MNEDGLAALATALIDLRQSRAAHFRGEMLAGEQVWNLLLILFIADSGSVRLSGRQAVEREGGSKGTGRRWIEYLTKVGYIAGDGDGNLDDVLSMTPRGLSAMEAWLAQASTRLYEKQNVSMMPPPRED